MSFKEALTKSSVANVVSAVVVIGGLAYAIYTKNTDLVSFITGAAIGYLYKKAAA